VVWDKDMLTKEYLGEVALPLDDWFRVEEGSVLGLDNPSNRVSQALSVVASLLSMLT
jgi:phosphatidylserine decarboxylase